MTTPTSTYFSGSAVCTIYNHREAGLSWEVMGVSGEGYWVVVERQEKKGRWS
nr:hypothetical protein [Tanacetum cinerariifolium]